MRTIYSLVATISYTFTFLFAEIQEVHHFKELKNYVDSDSFLLIDIDDTLLIPDQMLGCDEWFMERMKELQNNGFSFEEALEKVLFEWEGIRSLTSMQLVEEDCKQMIEELQEKKIPSICFTTQRFALAPRTIYQLNQHGIEMKRSSPILENQFFMTQNLGILFFDGVLFTNGTHKGKTLLNFCERNQLYPKKIVFINDKLSHLKEVELSCYENGIEFIGLRYAYSDKKKSSFDYTIAKFQSNSINLEKIISDEEAKTKK